MDENRPTLVEMKPHGCMQPQFYFPYNKAQ